MSLAKIILVIKSNLSFSNHMLAPHNIYDELSNDKL